MFMYASMSYFSFHLFFLVQVYHGYDNAIIGLC